MFTYRTRASRKWDINRKETWNHFLPLLQDSSQNDPKWICPHFFFTTCSTRHPTANLFRNSLFGRSKEKCASKFYLRSLLARKRPFKVFLMSSFWRTSQSWNFYRGHSIKLYHRKGCCGVFKYPIFPKVNTCIMYKKWNGEQLTFMKRFRKGPLDGSKRHVFTADCLNVVSQRGFLLRKKNLSFLNFWNLVLKHSSF